MYVGTHLHLFVWFNVDPGVRVGFPSEPVEGGILHVKWQPKNVCGGRQGFDTDKRKGGNPPSS